jgi:DedD protein
MEKKKLLLVAVSVGVFLVIVISASILIFTPKPFGGEGRAVTRTVNPGTVTSTPKPIPAGTGAKGIDGGASLQQEPVTPARTQPASADVVDMVRNADGLLGLQEPPPSAAGQGNNYHINGENTVSIDVRPRTAAGVPAPKTSTVAKAAPVTKPAAAKPAAAAAKPPAAKPAAEKPAAAKPAAARVNNDYWVQIGAFSAQVRAEGVKEMLASKGITTIIDDRNVDGQTMYRVRVGPYTSETEAGYWLALVKEIDGFSDSQIRASSRP